MDQLRRSIDLLERHDAIGLVRLISEECGIPNLNIGIGVFLVPPRLYDPEAEGWRILIDPRLTKIEVQGIKGSIRRRGLECRTVYVRHEPFVEIFRPRSVHAK
jgi:hypothetical protein